MNRSLPAWVIAGALTLPWTAPAFAAAPALVPAGETLVWGGEVRVAADFLLARGSTLRMEPGTTVRFAFRDDDGDGWGDASLRVEGELLVQGTPEKPVVFTGEKEPAEAGAWGELRVDFGSFDLRYAVIEGSTRGLHAHFSRGTAKDCIFRRNVDGTRLGESVVFMENNLFYGHPGKALNARNCRNRVVGNLFHQNRNGVFLFDGDRGSVFRANGFRDNHRPFRLGDFFDGEVLALENDWGGDLPVPDGSQDPTARLTASAGPAPDAGPRAWPFWAEERAAKTDELAPPAALPEAPFSAEGVRFEPAGADSIQASETSEDRILWRRRIGSGARPLLWPGGSAIAAGTADGRIFLLDRATGIERDCWEAGPVSSGPSRVGSGLFVNKGGGEAQVLTVRTKEPNR